MKNECAWESGRFTEGHSACIVKTTSSPTQLSCQLCEGSWVWVLHTAAEEAACADGRERSEHTTAPVWIQPVPRIFYEQFDFYWLPTNQPVRARFGHGSSNVLKSAPLYSHESRYFLFTGKYEPTTTEEKGRVCNVCLHTAIFMYEHPSLKESSCTIINLVCKLITNWPLGLNRWNLTVL